MRYFMSIVLSPEYDSGKKPVPQAIMDAMGPYVEKWIASGSLISTGGLKGSAQGARVNGNSGKTATTDGPFAEAKEVVGGYAVIEAPDKDAAIDIAKSFVQLHIDNGMPDVTVEVRQIDGGYNY
jgi:hypothetical protein